jgi:hypothetical protein
MRMKPTSAHMYDRVMQAKTEEVGIPPRGSPSSSGRPSSRTSASFQGHAGHGGHSHGPQQVLADAHKLILAPSTTKLFAANGKNSTSAAASFSKQRSKGGGPSTWTPRQQERAGRGNLSRLEGSARSRRPPQDLPQRRGQHVVVATTPGGDPPRLRRRRDGHAVPESRLDGPPMKIVLRKDTTVYPKRKFKSTETS